MPRITRNGDKSKTNGYIESPEVHGKDVQPESINALKRSRNECQEAEEPLRKRAVRDMSSENNDMPDDLVDGDVENEEEDAGDETIHGEVAFIPRITGHYRITISPIAKHHRFSTSHYTLTLFHHVSGEDSQIWAEFKFDHLKGIMRLLPEDLFNAKTEEWDVYDFIAYCKLPEEDRPSPDLSKWLMRWRGRDGGMRLNEHVGGEPWNAPGVFNFKFQREDEDGDEIEIGEDGLGMRFSVVFAYDCKLFNFCGVKVADLDESEIPDVEAMEQRWHSLDNPAWYADREEDEPEIDPEPRSESMFDLENTPMPPRLGHQKFPWEQSDDAAPESSSPVKRNDL